MINKNTNIENKKFDYFKKERVNLIYSRIENEQYPISQPFMKRYSFLQELVFIEDFMNIIEIDNDESIPIDILKINNLLLKTPTITADIRHRLYSTTLDCSATPILGTIVALEMKKMFAFYMKTGVYEQVCKEIYDSLVSTSEVSNLYKKINNLLFSDDFINKFGSYSGINNDNIEKDYSYINPDLALIQKTLKNEIASIIKKIKRIAVSTNNDYVNVQTESINSLYNELQSLLLLLDEVEDEINATKNSADTIDKDINGLFELLTNMEDTSPLDDININKASIYKDSKPTNNISVSKEDDKINPKNKPNVIKTPINTTTNKSTETLSDESLIKNLLNKNDARKARILNKITNGKPESDNRINSIIDNDTDLNNMFNEHYNNDTIDLTMKIDKAMSEIIVSLNNLRNSIIEDSEIPRTVDRSLFIRATYNNIVNKLEQLISNNKDTEVECDLVDNDTLEEYKVMSKLDLDDVDETEHNIYNGCLIINSDFIGGIFNNCTIIDTDELGLNKEELFDLIKIIERDDDSIG